MSDEYYIYYYSDEDLTLAEKMELEERFFYEYYVRVYNNFENFMKDAPNGTFGFLTAELLEDCINGIYNSKEDYIVKTNVKIVAPTPELLLVENNNEDEWEVVNKKTKRCWDCRGCERKALGYKRRIKCCKNIKEDLLKQYEKEIEEEDEIEEEPEKDIKTGWDDIKKVKVKSIEALQKYQQEEIIRLEQEKERKRLEEIERQKREAEKERKKQERIHAARERREYFRQQAQYRRQYQQQHKHQRGYGNRYNNARVKPSNNSRFKNMFG